MAISGSLSAFCAAMLAVSFLTSRAHAGTSCATDADCGRGFACHVVGGESCVGVACPPGIDCPPPPDCTPSDVKECIPGACNGNEDCAEGMVCFSGEHTTCTTSPAPSCAPNTKCESPAPDSGNCTTTNVNACVPRYFLPCAVASDCGAGFECVPDQECGCSGGTAMMDGGTPSQSPTCACTPASTNHCEPEHVACTGDAECPSSWTCETVQSPARACSVAVYPDGGTGPSVCDATEPAVEECVPAYYDLVGGRGLGSPGGTSEIPQFGSAGGTTGSPNEGSAGNSSAPKTMTSDEDGGCGCWFGRERTNTSATSLALVGLIAFSRRKQRLSVRNSRLRASSEP